MTMIGCGMIDYHVHVVHVDDVESDDVYDFYDRNVDFDDVHDVYDNDVSN